MQAKGWWRRNRLFMQAKGWWRRNRLSDRWEKLGLSERMPVKIIIIMVMMFIVH